MPRRDKDKNEGWIASKNKRRDIGMPNNCPYDLDIKRKKWIKDEKSFWYDTIWENGTISIGKEKDISLNTF